MRLVKWLFGLILAISLAMAGVAFLYSWSPSTVAQEAPPATAVTPRMTAKNAYSVAEPIANSWAKDASLLTIQGTWDPRSDFQSGEGNWTLVFYSAAQASTALISVIEMQAELLNVRAADEVMSPHSLESWEVDSPAAVRQLMLGGGTEFLRAQPSATVVLTLSLIEPVGWKGRLIHKESRRTSSIQFSARQE